MNQDARNALSDFFAGERGKLQRYVHKKVQSISDMDAEDLVADVLLSLFQKADLIGRADNLAAYVYRSLQNKVVDYLRKRPPPVSLDSGGEGEPSLLDLLSVDAGSVSGAAERKEFLGRLSEAVGRLEPRQRAVFIATEVHGKTFRELSQRWNEPVGTLLSRKCRAVKALRQMLADYQNE